MRLALTLLGLDLFSLEVTTDSDDYGESGDCMASGFDTGFRLPERDGGTPELVD